MTQGQGGIRLTQTALAALLNSPPRTIRDLQARDVMPKAGEDGKIELKAAIPAWVDYKVSQVKAPTLDDLEAALMEERRRKTAGDADMVEIKLAQKRGELVDSVGVEQAILQDFGAFGPEFLADAQDILRKHGVFSAELLIALERAFTARLALAVTHLQALSEAPENDDDEGPEAGAGDAGAGSGDEGEAPAR